LEKPQDALGRAFCRQGHGADLSGNGRVRGGEKRTVGFEATEAGEDQKPWIATMLHTMRHR